MTEDGRIARIEKWMTDLYRDAEKEMRGKWDAFMKNLRSEGDKLLRAIDDAKNEIAKKKAQRAYTAYMRDATITDRYYRQMVDELARQYANAGQRAAAIVNGERFGAFADGYNVAAGKINDLAVSRDIGIRFDLCDPNLIEYLEKHSEDLLLPPKADPSDLDMTVWNVHNINAQVTQGIVQGEGPDKVAERLRNVTRMNEAASIRTARTMMIGSRNAGYLQSLENAEDWGVNLKKVWYCRHDTKTRDSHLAMDGIGVKTNETFPNGCQFPGDPGGPAEEVYNCRCRMESELLGFSSTLPKGKEGAIRVRVDGEELEQGRSYYESPTKSRSADEYRAWAEKREAERKAAAEQRAARKAMKTRTEEKAPAPAPTPPKERTIAGVSRGAEMTHEQADSGAVNPNFGKDAAYGINCQSCVVAYEARRRGYDVEVVPNDADHPMCKLLSNDTLLAWKNPDGSKPTFAMGSDLWQYSGNWTGEKPTAARVEKKLVDTLEEGGRYTMQFSWKGLNAGGHIVMIEKSGGELKIYDPQPNRTYSGSEVHEYLKDLKFEKTIDGRTYYKEPAVVRVDDKEIDFDVANQIMEAKKT